jgi:hypothetical protein
MIVSLRDLRLLVIALRGHGDAIWPDLLPRIPYPLWAILADAVTGPLLFRTCEPGKASRTGHGRAAAARQEPVKGRPVTELTADGPPLSPVSGVRSTRAAASQGKEPGGEAGMGAAPLE